MKKLSVIFSDLAKKLENFEEPPAPVEPTAPAEPAEQAPATEPQKAVLAEEKTKDGKVLSVEGELVVGSAVKMADENGELVAAPDGKYELESNKEILVEAGLIVAVKDIEGEAAPAVPEAELQARINKLETELAAQKKISELTYEAIKRIGSLPSEEPEKSKFSKQVNIQKELLAFKSDYKKLRTA